MRDEMLKSRTRDERGWHVVVFSLSLGFFLQRKRKKNQRMKILNWRRWRWWRWNPRKNLLTVVPNAVAAIVGATTAIATSRSSADSRGASSARSARCPLRARTTWLATWRENTLNPRSLLTSLHFPPYIILTSVISIRLSKPLSSMASLFATTYLYILTIMFLLLVSEWGCMCDICVIQRMGNISSCRLLAAAHRSFFWRYFLLLCRSWNQCDFIALHRLFSFCFYLESREKHKQTLTSCSIPSLHKTTKCVTSS